MEKEAKQAIAQGQDYLEFYKTGFLDGYIQANRTRGRFANEEKVWTLIKYMCVKAFEMRFGKKLNKMINKAKINSKD